MAIAQFTLWGVQCQWLIARCVLDSSLFAPYLSQGKILFKGSSTVSCLTTLLADTPMRRARAPIFSFMSTEKSEMLIPVWSKPCKQWGPAICLSPEQTHWMRLAMPHC